MTNPLVSFIVPVYNTANYLGRCLDSIIFQTLKDIEIILIDDGSSDISGSICDEYAQKDNRIIVIHQPNQGVSVARQTGLDHATGDYVIHVDADDWIEHNEAEKMYVHAKKDDADMVIADYWKELDNSSNLISQDPGDISSHNVLLKMIGQKLHGCCWNKMIKRSTIQTYNVKFANKNVVFCEDLLFNCSLLCHAIKISYTNQAFYHYYWSNQSNLSNSLSKKRLQSRIFANSELEKMLTEEEKKYLYPQKKDVLYEAFMLKEFSILKDLYPDFQYHFIKNTGNFSIYTLIPSCMSLAFKGYPHTAYFIFKIITNLIKLKHILKI